MSCIRFAEFLLFLVFLSEVCSKEPEMVIKAEGNNVAMGYCFGVDYIVLYKSAPEGYTLLCNSSNRNAINTPPTDPQGRIEVKEDAHLLGLQISDLTELDSGIYRWECWRDQVLVSYRTEQVSVCRAEVSAEQITVSEDGGAELLCNSTSIGLKGTSVHWYQETYPSYNPTLFLDSSVSLKPLLEGLQGAVQARNSGAVLLLDKTVLKNNPHFYCLVIKGENCLSFQNMYPEDQSESREIFASLGDTVVLNCPADGNQQQWDTPLGDFNSNMRNNQMYISTGHNSEDFSLIIPVIAEEHSGKYSCISPSTEMEYSLLLCPRNQSQVKVAYEGSNISLECIFVPSESQRVQWQLLVPSGHYEAVADGASQSSPIPEHLSGKVSLSDSGHLLTISDVDMKDAGVYSCVVLKSPGFLYYGDDYDYNDTDVADDEYTAEEHFDETERCIFKQDIILNISVKGNTRLGTFPVTHSPAEQEKAPHVTGFAVGAGVVGLLLAVAAAALIARRRNINVSKAKRKETLNKGVDPDYTDKLTSNDDVA